MYIKTIELNNVQKHEHLVINLRQGINILWGRTGAGKSCIIHALQWVLANDFSSDSIRKDGTKKTSVSITLDNDVVVTRTKSDSVNRYEIKYPDGKEEVHDSIGKSIPDSIKNIFNLPIMSIDGEEVILNIQGQFEQHFLLTSKATFRNKVLNKLTGNNLLDKLIKIFNSDLLNLNRDEKQFKEIKTSTHNQIAQKTEELNQKQKILDAVEDKLENIKIEQEEIDLIESDYNELLNLKQQVKNSHIELEDILIPNIEDFKIEVETFDKINAVYINLLKVKENIETVKAKQLYQIPDINDDLRNSIALLEELEDTALKLNRMQKNKIKLKSDIAILTQELEKNIKQYNDMVKQIPKIVCPNCKTEIKEAQIEEIK